jgi:hypothetical protein
MDRTIEEQEDANLEPLFRANAQGDEAASSLSFLSSFIGSAQAQESAPGKGDKLAIALYDCGYEFTRAKCPKESGDISSCTDLLLVEPDEDVVWRKFHRLGGQSWQDSGRFDPRFDTVGLSLFSGQRRHLEPERTSPR